MPTYLKQREALTFSPRSPGYPGGPTGPSYPGRPGFPASPYEFPQLINNKNYIRLCNSIGFKTKTVRIISSQKLFRITFLDRI